jgi:hypothetical protein
MVKAIALTLVCMAQCFAMCQSEPKISVDSLTDGKVAIQADYTQSNGAAMAKFMNFTDTITPDFLYQWVAQLYHSKTYSLLATVDTAWTDLNWVVAQKDTGLGCTDVVYPVAAGEEYAEVRFRTAVKVVRRYKGEQVDSIFQWQQNDVLPKACVPSKTGYPENPYSVLIGKQFLYFTDTLTQLPNTGPFPNHVCQWENGFFVDSLGRITKSGRTQTESSLFDPIHLSMAKSTGVPGISIPLDSLEWAFANVTSLRQYHTRIRRLPIQSFIRSQFKSLRSFDELGRLRSHPVTR